MIDAVGDRISGIVLRRGAGRGWLAALAASGLLLALLPLGIAVLLARGVGVWGVNVPVAWGLAITNFVWWIGIGHAGTLISAILLLLRQQWRTSINRFAEAMTLFAVACAGLFPLLHLGRPSLFYWLLPYPDTMGLWPQFRSPLVWDVFAVSTYFTVSLLFWYVGLIPDLASLRDRARRPLVRRVYGVLAMGWRGSAEHWRRHQTAYLLLAGLATPLVVSVHSVVSLDFAVALLPGWHSTIFPPYFVAGAIFSGFAMVLVIAIPLRAAYGFPDLVTDEHLDNMAKVMLATGLLVAYGYAMEWLMTAYGGTIFEKAALHQRFHGPYAPASWAMIVLNVLAPQALWLPSARRSAPILFGLSILILVGMWLERFVIVVTATHRDFLPSSWGLYAPTRWDWAVFAGSLGLFATSLLLFIRFLPMISMAEMRELAAEGGGP
ncbi:MAG TPA: NrfD/PsrC family molybdoenzyme membrane anchor subunit [Elusimicrobiota bacterium]|nr:NrfD/PsrC family molybdoenzyme membrane anchor subunit [Elusimicrobiota bacterium]